MSKIKHHNIGSIPRSWCSNDFFFFFLGGGGGGRGSLSPPMLNIFTVGNTGVMICLGQGGLHCLSTFSSKMFLVFFFLNSQLLI